MIEIRRSALVRHSPARMFELVNDVEAYPKRFGWCSDAKVLERDGDALVARLDLRFAGLRHSFTTRNVSQAPDRITVDLVEGPFHTLEGQWSFEALGDKGCKVGLTLDFDYTGRFGGMALKLGFQQLANRMVDDFCREARRTYG
ncbi:MAG TPA: type II toxin-antitoxin system RatA family toxin [Rhodanobacteraceae bacterium]